MGFLNSNLPPVEPDRLFDLPYMERIRVLSRHWAEHGFGAPKITHVVYIAKLLVLLRRRRLPGRLGHVGAEPAASRRLVDRADRLPEADLVDAPAGVPGPGRLLGADGGAFQAVHLRLAHYFRVDTIRQPPWPGKVPFTRGDRRSGVDVALYAALLGTILAALARPGVGPCVRRPRLPCRPGVPDVDGRPRHAARRRGPARQGVLPAARGEQYLPALIFFAAYGVRGHDRRAEAADRGGLGRRGRSPSSAGTSRNVVPPMVSNTPWLPRKCDQARCTTATSRRTCARPSAPTLLAHVGGTFVEIVDAAGPAVLAQPDRDRRWPRR